MEILLQLFVAICMFAFVGWIIYIVISATKQEYSELKKALFTNKNLPIVDRIEMNKALGFVIELYDFERNFDESINRDNYWFAKATKIINNNLYLDAETMELCMNDLTDSKFRSDYDELMRVFSNFNFNIFVLKENAKHKNVMDAGIKHQDEIKAHTNRMIEKCFYELINIYAENGMEIN